MKTRVLLAGMTSLWAVFGHAHPGSGIVVDPAGQVYFQDSAARTIWKIDARGAVSAHNDKIGGHWMALDTTDRFSRADLKLVERISPAGVPPVLLVADGGAPLAFGGDGHLYYGAGVNDRGEVSVGLMRIAPTGKPQPFALAFAKSIEDLGVTGLSRGPDGALYVACLTGVMKVQLDGKSVTIANPVVAANCDSDAPTVFLRGLDVDSSGTIYVAATGCRSVLRIAANGTVETVLKAERPWSPTGVALHRGDIYVLEYTNANGGLADGWLPRVRRRRADGSVAILASITEAQQRAQPNRQKLE